MKRIALAITISGAALLAACSDKPADTAVAASASAPASSAAAVDPYAVAAKGHGFTVGPMMAANTVYVFFDTTCPHCAHLWQSSQPLLGQLKMVWMPIGLLRPQSLPQGATILASSDPVATMNLHEAGVNAGQPGITPAKDLPDAALAQVRENTELYRQLGETSVPLVVYRNAQSGQIGKRAGALDTATLKALVGL